MTEKKAEGKMQRQKRRILKEVEEKKSDQIYKVTTACTCQEYTLQRTTKKTELLVWKCCRLQQGEKRRVEQRWHES